MSRSHLPPELERPVRIATRGSPLALAQAHYVRDALSQFAPLATFELKIIKTSGDKLQSASMANPKGSLPKGLFTKEIEEALLNEEADIAVHSLKDLPTELPNGLSLSCVPVREDALDVLVVKSKDARLPTIRSLATSSVRRAAQAKALAPDLTIEEIRGNVGTRLRKLSENAELDATMLAAAGLSRLGYRMGFDGSLSGPDAPDGLFAVTLDEESMTPAPGQGALGLETRESDALIPFLRDALNDAATERETQAERAFLKELGGGCQTPVAALARVDGDSMVFHAVSFLSETPSRGRFTGSAKEPVAFGQSMARLLKSS